MGFFSPPRRLKIQRGENVLEIGPGARPHPRSTVLLDRYLNEHHHREGQPIAHGARPLVIADGSALPFRDGAFDYCVCSHVLEHAEDAEAMIQEMQRVARRGYIECPSELGDWLFEVPPYTEIHKWYVNLIDGELVLTRKRPEFSKQRYSHLFDYVRRKDPHFEHWLEKRPHLFTVQYEWEGRIRYRVTDEPPTSRLLADTTEVAKFFRARSSNDVFFWGTGLWGFKRYVYSRLAHPAWRKQLKKVAKLLRGRG